MSTSGPDVYRRLGVEPILSACGANTAQGGTKLRPEVMSAMNAAAGTLVEMDDLNRAAGDVLARHTGAEAGLVCSGSAGGLVLQAAAVVAGADRARMSRLPDTRGMPNEIVIHRAHRFPYDQCYRAVGARLVEVGDGRRCQPWQLEAAIGERTAAVAYLFSPRTTRNALPLRVVCELAHERNVPVIVNAASFLPPRANLKRFIAAGADMVVYSGGKAVRGPQGTGILVGRRDLIDAAAANASPAQFLGRGLKVAKEEIVGLVAALDLFVATDEAVETARYRAMCERAAQLVGEHDGIEIDIQHDELDRLIPHLVLSFTSAWTGPDRDTVRRTMIEGSPSIRLHDMFDPWELAIDPLNLDDQELDVVASRLAEVLRAQSPG